MAEDAKEPTGSMGDDTPLAVLSDKYRPMQPFLPAEFQPGDQPADRPLREYRVMSLKTRFGNLKNVLDEDSSQTEILVLELALRLQREIMRPCASIGDGAVHHRLHLPAGDAGARRAARRWLRIRARPRMRCARRASHLILTDEAVRGPSAWPMPMILATRRSIAG
jgi:glutamate synthase (NADPH/NADH) large chain